MKLIISYQNGRVEMLAVASVDDLQFTGECVIVQFGIGNAQYIQWSDVRSIVIA